MAYSSKYNPDALPAHAEPEQAAQILAGYGGPSKPQAQQQQQPPPQQQQPPPLSHARPPHQGSSIPPHPSYSQPPRHAYTNKAQPPLPPSSAQQDQGGYRRPSNPPTTSPGYGSQGPYQPPASQGYGGGGPGGGGGRGQGSWPATQNTSPRPQHGHLASASVPQAGSDPGLFPLFRAVDVRGTGQLSEEELGKALRNGDYSNFDLQTVRMMIKMFDHDGSGTVSFDEFCGLWGFLAAWRSLFDRFDEDRSGYISYEEYSKALVAFGYHLTPAFVHTLYRIYDRRGTDTMSFDLFVQSCISLKRMTDVFKRYDTDRDGYITLSFEEFLTEILNQR